ncbi:MAG: gamma-glutamylcyclotransferase [Traorella sp.]
MYLFTYGTLMKEERNHGYLNNSLFIGEAILEGYGLVELSSYPGMIPLKNSKVRGEVYEIDETTKTQLDILEGDEYVYHSASAIMKEKMIQVFFYEYKNRLGNKKPSFVIQNRWLSDIQRKNYVWYVCYGSNLLSKRFDKYIQQTTSKSKPLSSHSVILPFELYFAKRSSRWSNQGVAFLDVNQKGKTYGKAYLIHQQQFKEIQQHEGSTWYDLIYPFDEDEYGIRYVTLTHSSRFTDESHPDEKYLDIMRLGLKETYELKENEIEEYLNQVKRSNTHMKFETLDFRQEVNHEKLNKMEKEILKYQNFNIKNLSPKQKASFEEMLEDFIKMQGEYGFFPLVVDDAIPNDCMYYYNRRPSYIILGLLMQNGNPEHEEVIQKALDGCLLSKFYGTSYEAQMQQFENLTMLLKSGLLYYANSKMWNLVFAILQQAKYVLSNTNQKGIRKEAQKLVDYFKGGDLNERN